MSFILDALKKSESDRQQQGPAEFAGVPTSNDRPTTPRWLWVLGVLLAINLAVLIGLFLRPDGTSTPIAQTPTAVDSEAFAEQVAVAKQNVPPREEPRDLPQTVVQQPPATNASVQSAAPAPLISQPAPARSRPANNAALPTIHEVIANGLVTLPALHVDIHVYGDQPKDRFVFINMNKHVEGSMLAEGPVVDEITSDGVVLTYNGIVFLLPRD